MSTITLPNSLNFLKVLLQAEQSNTPLKIKSCFLPLLQSILPHIYGFPSETPSYSTLNSKNCILLLSGGLGSVSSLWYLLQQDIIPIIYYFEGFYERELELSKKKCIQSLLLESRCFNGYPLIELKTMKTCLKSIRVPPEAKSLSRKSRIAFIISLLYEEYKGEKPQLVWGNIQDCRDVLNAMKLWGFDHFIPFPNIISSLFTLCKTESISDTIREKYILNESYLSPSAILPKEITNIVCSSTCQISRKKIEEEHGKIYMPFLSMCTFCDGCKRYIQAWKEISNDIPQIRVGSYDLDKRDDHRHYENIPTLREEAKTKKSFAEYINEKSEAKDKKKRGKKKKEEKNEEEEEEEIEEDDELDEEDDELLLLEDPDVLEEIEDQDEIIEEIDYDFGESDGESENKKKKKKKIV